MQWANSGEGYTPVVRKETTESTDVVDELDTIHKEMVALCTKLGGTKNAELMETLKTYIPSGNPKGIKDIVVAKECLDKLKAIKPVE